MAAFVLHFLALRRGSLHLVQTVLVAGLLFALPIAAALVHQRLRKVDWAWRLEELAVTDDLDVVREETAAAMAQADRLTATVTELLDFRRFGRVGDEQDLDLADAVDRTAACGVTASDAPGGDWTWSPAARRSSAPAPAPWDRPSMCCSTTPSATDRAPCSSRSAPPGQQAPYA